MNKTLLILGAGGHGRVAAEIAESLGYTIPFLDDKPSEGVIGSISELEKFGPEFDACFIGIGNNAVRHKLQDRLVELGLSVATLISPRAYVSSSVKVGCGTVIEPGTVVNANVTMRKRFSQVLSRMAGAAGDVSIETKETKINFY